MKIFVPILVLVCCVAAPVLADLSSIRPKPRPTQEFLAVVPLVSADSGVAMFRSIRPFPRPEIFRPESFKIAAKAPLKGLLGTSFGAKNAIAKPPGVHEPQEYKSGSVCKDSAIQGTAIPAIRGAQKGCGIENPVRITAVDGVTLSTPTTIDCDTARALRTWVTNKVKPAFGRNEVTGLRIAAHYACRGRNNKKGARISEHGRGKAIDISGFQLQDGSEVTVLQDYKSGRGKAMHATHKGACGIFGTTLGPGSDGHHRDHLHLDTAKYRGGPYCK